MRILITRPRSDADALAERLHAQGHTTVIEPLIDIAFTDGAPLDVGGVQALLFTSANAARAASGRTTERALHVLAVGPATAAEAKALGFTHVTESSGEGVDALAETARQQLDPAAGTLLHVTGTVTAGDLKSALEPSGFVVRTERLYEARASTHLSTTFTTELTAGRIDTATFFSPRTADRFVTLILAAGLAAACREVTAVALSPTVAKALAPLAFRKILVAAHPTTAALLDQLKHA